jgi:hypothetical protein
LVISVDGQPLPAALINVQHPIDPGAHAVEATVDGAPHFRQELQIAERDQVRVDVPPLPVSADATPAGTPVPIKSTRTTPPPPPPPAGPAPARSWIAPVAFSAGGAGVGVAVVSGILAADRRQRLKTEWVCDPGCPAAAEPDLDAFRLYRGLFFLGTAMGVAGLGIGTYFAIWGPDSSQEVALDLGPTGASLSGRF